MIFVDTGFFVALSQPADALHSSAKSWAGATAGPFLTTEYVLWETVNALSKPIDRPKAHRLLDWVRSTASYQVVVASEGIFESGLQLHREREDKEWSLTDCISFLLMRERGISEALAYDQNFEQAGFVALLGRDPS